jgi:hypothetical protein
VVGVPAGHAPLLLSHLVVDVVLCFPVFFFLLLAVVVAAANSSMIGYAITAAAADSSAIGYAITAAAAVPCGGGIVAGTRAWLWGGNTKF